MTRPTADRIITAPHSRHQLPGVSCQRHAASTGELGLLSDLPLIVRERPVE